MSQIIFKAQTKKGRTALGITGWDRQTKAYHFSAWLRPLGDEPEDEEPFTTSDGIENVQMVCAHIEWAGIQLSIPQQAMLIPMLLKHRHEDLGNVREILGQVL